MLVIVEVNVAQVPGVCELLPAPIKHPGTAQVPAWPGGGGGPGESGAPTAQTPCLAGNVDPCGVPWPEGIAVP